MSNKLLKSLVAGTLATTLALASPALARGGGMGGGMHVGGMGGGMHAGGMGGGMPGGGMHFGGGPPHLGAMGGGAHFSGRSFAAVSGGGFVGPRFAHAGFAPRFSRFAFHDRRFFFHRHHRFAFIGAPFIYANYDSCWRRVWTSYGPHWVNVCRDYGYY
jgi:hypothetical protein